MPWRWRPCTSPMCSRGRPTTASFCGAGSSDLALLGARAFDDHAFFRALTTTVQFAAFPVRQDATIRFAARNHVGDAVLLYAFTHVPLWQRVKERAP